jgi:hypothetical protein
MAGKNITDRDIINALTGSPPAQGQRANEGIVERSTAGPRTRRPATKQSLKPWGTLPSAQRLRVNTSSSGAETTSKP